MSKPMLALILVTSCGGFRDYGDVSRTSRATIRLVDDNQPARGVRVRVVTPTSEPMGEAITDDDGVAAVELSNSGRAWLVVNTGDGRGTLVRFTATPEGKNDLGERSLAPLTEFPDLLTLRNVGFEERLTDGDDTFVSSFALAGEGVVAVEVLGERGSRVVHFNLATPEVKTLREVTAETRLGPVQVKDGVVAWWVETPASGRPALQAVDLRSGELFAQLRPPAGQLALELTEAWLIDDRLQLVLAAPNANGLPWRLEGFSLELGRDAPESGVVLLSASSQQRTLWPSSAQSTLWVHDLAGARVVAFDVATFALLGEVRFPGLNQHLMPSDTCMVSSNEQGLWRAMPGQPAEQLLPPSEDPLGWVLAGPPGERRWVQGRVAGSAVLAEVDCTRQPTSHQLPAGTCGPSCVVDAFDAPFVRVVEQEEFFQGVPQRSLWVRRWQLDASEATDGWRSEKLAIANYVRGAPPVLELSQASAAQQLYVGVPDEARSFRTWIPAARNFRGASDGRLVYLMRDPLTERQQLFVLRGTP